MRPLVIATRSEYDARVAVAWDGRVVCEVIERDDWVTRLDAAARSVRAQLDGPDLHEHPRSAAGLDDDELPRLDPALRVSAQLDEPDWSPPAWCRSEGEPLVDWGHNTGTPPGPLHHHAHEAWKTDQLRQFTAWLDACEHVRTRPSLWQRYYRSIAPEASWVMGAALLIAWVIAGTPTT